MDYDNCTYSPSDEFYSNLENFTYIKSFLNDNEMDLVSLIEKKNEELDNLHYYQSLTISTINIGLLALTFSVYTFITSPLIAVINIGLEHFHENIPYGEIFHQASKIALSIGLMNNQYNFLKQKSFLDNPAINAAHYILGYPLNFMFINIFNDLGHKLIDHTTAYFSSNPDSFHSSDIISEEQYIYKFEQFSHNIIKRGFKYIAKSEGFSPFIQAMFGDYFKSEFSYYYNQFNNNTLYNPKENWIDITKNNFIKYVICYPFFPKYMITYTHAMGMFGCQVVINNLTSDDYCDILYESIRGQLIK